MSLLDILGNYYDSATNTMVRVPESAMFEVRYKIKSLGCASIEFDLAAYHDNTSYQIDTGYYAHTILDTVNKMIPSFYVNKDISEGTVRAKGGEHETFHIVMKTPDNRTWSVNAKGKISHESMIKEWFDQLTSIPKEFIIQYTIVRTNNKILRDMVGLKATDGKLPQEYFAKVCDASFRTDKVTGRWDMNGAFQAGSIKSIIVNKRRKADGIFLAEYLYGVKIPKSATYEEYFKRLANRPQTDFGVKDVQVLKQLMQICRGGTGPASRTEQLLKIGIKPATDLSRWYRQYPDIKSLLDILTLAQK